jgi:hypothetical protein
MKKAIRNPNQMRIGQKEAKLKSEGQVEPKSNEIRPKKSKKKEKRPKGTQIQ